MKEIMSCLIKDPVNSGLAQLDHAQSNSKKWPKVKTGLNVHISSIHSAKFKKRIIRTDLEL